MTITEPGTELGEHSSCNCDYLGGFRAGEPVSIELHDRVIDILSGELGIDGLLWAVGSSPTRP